MKFLREVFCFGLSGFLAFLVDTAVLYILWGYFGPYSARGVSFLAAVATTWIFNRSVTFKQRRSSLNAQWEFLTYLLLMLGGGAVNYGIYAWLIMSYQLVVDFPVIGVAAGSLSGMIVNLTTSRFILYHQHVDKRRGVEV